MSYNKLIREGSSKILFGESNDPKFEHIYLDFVFTSHISVFDRGPIPVEFPQLDKLRCAIACKIFQTLEDDGIMTHYVCQMSQNRMRTLAVSVPEFSFKATNGYRLLPLEILWRKEGDEKFANRVRSGEMSRERFKLKLGYALGPGMLFNPTFVECSTKHEGRDRYILDDEACSLAEITEDELQALYKLVRNAERSLTNLFYSTYINVTAGKFEIAYVKGIGFMICDTVSPDELTLSDQMGNSYDKNPIRKWYKEKFPHFYQELMAMKELFPNDKEAWPSYPDVPPEHLITQVCESYEKVAEELGC